MQKRNFVQKLKFSQDWAKIEKNINEKDTEKNYSSTNAAKNIIMTNLAL